MKSVRYSVKNSIIRVLSFALRHSKILKAVLFTSALKNVVRGDFFE